MCGARRRKATATNHRNCMCVCCTVELYPPLSAFVSFVCWLIHRTTGVRYASLCSRFSCLLFGWRYLHRVALFNVQGWYMYHYCIYFYRFSNECECLIRNMMCQRMARSYFVTRSVLDVSMCSIRADVLIFVCCRLFSLSVVCCSSDSLKICINTQPYTHAHTHTHIY